MESDKYLFLFFSLLCWLFHLIDVKILKKRCKKKKTWKKREINKTNYDEYKCVVYFIWQLWVYVCLCICSASSVSVLRRRRRRRINKQTNIELSWIIWVNWQRPQQCHHHQLQCKPYAVIQVSNDCWSYPFGVQVKKDNNNTNNKPQQNYIHFIQCKFSF